MNGNADIAWAAGLFEGEGCISFERTSPPYPKLALTMTDEDAVRRFAEIVGRGSVGELPLRAERYKIQWSWRVHGIGSYEVFLMLRPWLCKRRRERGDEVFAAWPIEKMRRLDESWLRPKEGHKACPRCKEVKPLSAFSRSKIRRDGAEIYCRACRSAARRAA